MQIYLHVLIAESLKSLKTLGSGGVRASRLPIPYNFGLFLWRSESRRVFLAKLASTAAVKSTPV